jgi:hypothetical protein
MRYVRQNKFLRLTLEFFPENLDTDSDEWGILSPRNFQHGKAGPGQVECKYAD